MRQWQPDDVYDVICPYCKAEIEFFKDDSRLNCPSCGKKVRNPKLDLGCAQWCEFADKCLGELIDITDRRDDERLQ